MTQDVVNYMINVLPEDKDSYDSRASRHIALTTP